jgi:hypothetical protein
MPGPDPPDTPPRSPAPVRLPPPLRGGLGRGATKSHPAQQPSHPTVSIYQSLDSQREKNYLAGRTLNVRAHRKMQIQLWQCLNYTPAVAKRHFGSPNGHE